MIQIDVPPPTLRPPERDLSVPLPPDVDKMVGSPFHGNISRHDEESSIHMALHPSMKTAEDGVIRLPFPRT
jgi:hypothetical protein